MGADVANINRELLLPISFDSSVFQSSDGYNQLEGREAGLLQVTIDHTPDYDFPDEQVSKGSQVS